MQFYEKLTFIMDLTRTSNRMLARELKVDPSLVSRLRTGARGVPRNQEHLKAMAVYFARHCTAHYQRQALSEVLSVKPDFIAQDGQLPELLYYWLCGATEKAGQSIRTLDSLPLSAAADAAAASCLTTNNFIYYGNEGKRAAARALYQHLLSMDNPCTVYLFADETDDWISEDREFSHSLQDWGKELLRRGFRLRQITPPSICVDQAIESLVRWLPLYSTGLVDVSFYPRIRDGVHRRSLVIAPGEIALMSNSIANRRSCYATILTTDHRLIQAYETEFLDYLSMCRPLIAPYASPETLMPCMTYFLLSTGARIQAVSSLSAETAPPELIKACALQSNRPDFDRLAPLYLQELQQMQSQCTQFPLIDLVPLASAAQVRAGLVPIIFSYGLGSTPLYYTPETYVLHLKNILHIMRQYQHYHFVPITDSPVHGFTLLVRENQRALLVRLTTPLTVFELAQPEYVALCREHLLRLAEQTGYTGAHRIKNMAKIQQLIQALQS